MVSVEFRDDNAASGSVGVLQTGEPVIIPGTSAPQLVQVPHNMSLATIIPLPGIETDDITVPHFWYGASKRVFDVVFATLLILVLAPIWLTAALLIRMTSGRRVLYHQIRVRENGLIFKCYKFRTMVPDAHIKRVELVALNEASGPVFKLRRDPRVTPVGRWLRKFSIDEMPQLINVIRGEMSIVGPRPPIPEEVAQYTPRQMRRLTVKPGLTCLWQVSGRSHIGFDEWVELDLQYIRRRSLWYDLWLILLTIPAVITARGAF